MPVLVTGVQFALGDRPICNGSVASVTQCCGFARREDILLLRTSRVIALSTIPVLLLLLLVGNAFAQATTGALKGEVVDQAQAPLAGVAITLKSDALLSSRNFDTLEDGRFRFFALPPGTYEMEISKEGFKTILRRNLDVSVGRTISLQLVMEVPELGETVEVIDRRPIVDTESTSNSMSLNADFLKDLPSGRTFQDVVQFLPGVTGGANPSINGGTGQQNRYYLDGANTTDPVLGTFSMNFNFDAIEDLEVITAGYDARYNQGLGGTINIVTKSGGNNFEGNFSGYIEGTGLGTTGDEFVQDASAVSQTIGTLNASLGGPIVRDRFWFYIAYQFQHRYTQPSTEGETLRDFGKFPLAAVVRNSHYIIGKLTAQPFTGNKFTLTMRGDPTNIDNIDATDPGAVFQTAEGLAWREQGGFSATLQHAAQLGGRGTLTTQVIYQFSRIHQMPMAWQECEVWDAIGRCEDAERNQPAIFDEGRFALGLDHGTGGRYQLSRRHNLQVKSDLRIGIDRLLGSHTLDVGVEVNPIWHDSTQGFTGNQFLVKRPRDANNDGEYTADEINDTDNYENVDRYIMVAQADSRTPGVVVNAYMQDRWVPVRGLTINAGFRFSYATLQNNIGHTIIDTKDVGFGAGVAWDPFRDGRTRLSVNYASQVSPALLETSGWINQNTWASERYSWDESQRRWGEQAARASSPTSSITHPDQIPARSHEVFAMAQREIARDLSAEVNFIWRRQRHIWEDDEVNVLWNEDGTDAVGFRNGSNGQVKRLRTPEDAYRTYWALTLRVRKNLSDNFTLEASYVYSRNVANASGRANALDGRSDSPSEQNAIDRIGASQDYNNPTQRWHERGLAENDLPHVLKLLATYDNPGAFKISEKFSMGYALGGALTFASGLPINRKQYNDYTGNYANYLNRRGSGERLPARLDLDLRGSLAFKIAGTQFDVIVQVDNVLNSLQPTRADERAVGPEGETVASANGNPAYAAPLDYQSARRFQFGLRFTF
jgi:hypothetical protein